MIIPPATNSGRHAGNSDPVPMDNLRLETSNRTVFMGCRITTLNWSSLNPPKTLDIITILFLNRTVRIKGKNLRNLGVALQNACVWIHQANSRSVIHRWLLG